MVTTNSPELWEFIWAYKDHGKAWDAVYGKEHPPGFRWLHEGVGTNARMTELQATIGRIQLKRMPDWHKRRLDNATAIWRAAREINGLRVPDVPACVEHAAYKCYVFVEPESLRAGWSRDRIMHEVSEQGMRCFSGSCSEIYLEKAFESLGCRPERRLPVAKELGETSLMFLVHPTLSPETIERTCEVLRGVMKRAVR